MPPISDEMRREAIEAAEEALELYKELGGLTDQDALDLLIAILDAALPMRALIPGIFGEAAELATDQALRVSIEALQAALRPDPDRLLTRAAKAEARGRTRVALRRRAKAMKLMARQAEG
jgi:hypothetical protein